MNHIAVHSFYYNFVVAAAATPTSRRPLPATPSMAAQTLHHNCRERFGESGNVLTLALVADASVSRKGANKNFDDSKRLYVTNDDGGER